MYQLFTKTAARVNACSAMGREAIQKSRVSPKNDRSRGNFLMTAALLLVLGAAMQSCCMLMPNFNTKDVSVSVTPSNADILFQSGNKAGTGSCRLHFGCGDKQTAYYQLTLQAAGYRTKVVKVYKSNSSISYTLDKKVDTYVNVSVTPSSAGIYYRNGNKAGTGSCQLTFDEDEKPNTYYELTLDAPNYYSQTVKVLKSDGSKSFTLARKPIKTVVVIPAEAEISVNNEPVGKGRYDISFENKDRVLLTFKAVGYETASYYLLKSNTEQTVTYELDKDEAYENSLGGATAAQYANKWVPITVRKGLSQDEVWLRMMSIVREHFEQIEKTDKSSGWIKTFPALTPYKASDVRTTLEIAPSYSTGEMQYKVRLYFEKRKKGSGNEGWEKYDRLMKMYRDVIPNMLNSVGGGM
ncbi:MAG: hypothetical protein LBL94_03730 [Prevotellaceae bacterium]|jgi:hypothetical protein|nr:hypothetical protein [Prevotellaceae bacterium]